MFYKVTLPIIEYYKLGQNKFIDLFSRGRPTLESNNNVQLLSGLLSNF